MQHRKLGSLDVPSSNELHGQSVFYGATEDAEAITTIERALKLGIDFLDPPQLHDALTSKEVLGRAIKAGPTSELAAKRPPRPGDQYSRI